MALCYGRTCICCSGCRCCRLPPVGWARTTSSACCSAPSRFVSIIDLACLGEEHVASHRLGRFMFSGGSCAPVDYPLGGGTWVSHQSNLVEPSRGLGPGTSD